MTIVYYKSNLIMKTKNISKVIPAGTHLYRYELGDNIPKTWTTEYHNKQYVRDRGCKESTTHLTYCLFDSNAPSTPTQVKIKHNVDNINLVK